MRSSNPIMILLCLPEKKKQIIFASQYFSSFPWVERTYWRQNIQRWDEKCFWLRLCCLRSNDYVCANDGNCRSEGATICAAPGWLSFNNFPFPFANNIIVFISALLVTQANDVIVRGFDKTISLLNISNFFQHNIKPQLAMMTSGQLWKLQIMKQDQSFTCMLQLMHHSHLEEELQ